jgi:hypothetical protein
MTSDRIRQIQEGTAYPNSVSVQQALLQVWNECQQENNNKIEILNREKQLAVESLLTIKNTLKDLFN